MGNMIAPANGPALLIPERTCYIYDGKPKMPAVTVMAGTRALLPDVDYTLEYAEGRTQAGKYAITATAKGYFSGTAEGEFTVVPADIASLAVAPIEPQLYTGQAIEPAVSVIAGMQALVAGTDYTVEYADNVEAGQATALVKGTGNYTGSIKVSFAIEAPEPEVPAEEAAAPEVGSETPAAEAETEKLTAETEAPAVETASEEEVLVEAAVEDAAVPAAPLPPKIKVSAKKKGFKASWAKAEKGVLDGYQIRYATKKSMKAAKKTTTMTRKATECIVTKLRPEKKYYVQLRAFKKVGSKKVFGPWGKTKSIITK